MKVLDVKDVKLVPQPEDSECEATSQQEGKELVLPQSNVKRVMLIPSVLLVQAFNILMSFATFFVWLLYTSGGSAITREGTIFFLLHQFCLYSLCRSGASNRQSSLCA